MYRCLNLRNVSLEKEIKLGIFSKKSITTIIENISFDLNFGEILTIIGPNGGGKTTLLRCILGLEKKYTGQVEVFTNKIGYMPQRISINNMFPIKVKDFLLLSAFKNFSNLSVKNIPKEDKNCNYCFFENNLRSLNKNSQEIVENEMLKGEKNTHSDINNLYNEFEKINFDNSQESSLENVLNFVNIKKLANSCITNLSLGELQKVLFANAIISSPELIILDEPTQGLDFSSQIYFFDMLLEINRHINTTVVIVSHDLQNVLSRSNKVLCMNKSLQCFGQPSEICNKNNNISHYNHTHQ